MNKIRRPSPGTALAVAALVIALGGAAFAAIPDSNGTIHGCYQKNSGALRVVDSASGCRSSEVTLDWNQRGPTGPPGPNAARTVFDKKTAEISTASRTPVEFDGPSVELTVPPSGLIAVTHRSETRAVDRDPVALTTSVLDIFVDGQLHERLRAYSVLGDEFVERFQQWFVVEISPGPHRFSFAYSARCDGACTDSDRAFFKNRKLWVTPLG